MPWKGPPVSISMRAISNSALLPSKGWVSAECSIQSAAGLKEALSQRLLTYLFEKLPHLKDKIDFYELSTTLSTDFFCRYEEGEIYGLQHDPKRFEQQWLKPKTEIKGLYLTGQDVLSCGVVGAMMAGLITAIQLGGLKGLLLAKKIFFAQ